MHLIDFFTKNIWSLQKLVLRLHHQIVSNENKIIMIYRFFIILLTFLSTFKSNNTTAKLVSNSSEKAIAAYAMLPVDSKAVSLYKSLDANNYNMPNIDSFTNAINGFYDLKDKGLIKKDILTIVDFSLSSNTKRLWIIDMTTNTILLNTLVAHGMNTGNEFANSFSNAMESHKSSLGFYSTGEVYVGKHGMSLKLDGLEKGINDKARARDVVIHGANYVSESYIRSNSKLGRSHGCPAIPVALTKKVIGIVKEKSCLYIYHPSRVGKFGTKLFS